MTWRRTTEGWSCTGSVGFGPLEGTGWLGGASSGLVYAAGRAPAGPSVTVEFRNERHEIPVDEHGLWAFARYDGETPFGQLPSELPTLCDE